MIFTRTILVATIAVVFSCPAIADFTGKVVSIADGDTITVLVDHSQIKVRLIEMDAPEKKQASAPPISHSVKLECAFRL